MKKLNKSTVNAHKAYPHRVIQFGGGNFLRAFFNWILDEYNEKTDSDYGVLLTATIAIDNYKKWQEQDGLYHVLTRGYKDGEIVDESQLIECISDIIHLVPEWDDFLASAANPDTRFVVSNTTEAGIKYSAKDSFGDNPPVEFPAKLTRWLFERYKAFKGDKTKGCIIIPVELIIDNGPALKKCILQNAENWNLESGFITWINEANTFCSTLVDRIVPGVSRDSLSEEWEKLGFEDTMITQGEAFHFWAIEAPESVREEFPLDKIGLNIVYTDDLGPFRKRKVRILNGAHTSMVPVGYLYGIEAVKEAVEHDVMGKFVRKAVYDEIIPSLDLPKDEVKQFADDVMDRFKNPFIHHQLISISLNSVSKFKTRVLPSILDYSKEHGQVPDCLTFSMASLLNFYRGEFEGRTIPLNDDKASIDKIQNLWSEVNNGSPDYSSFVQKILAIEEFWNQDLNLIDGLHAKVTSHMNLIHEKGMKEALASLV